MHILHLNPNHLHSVKSFSSKTLSIILSMFMKVSFCHIVREMIQSKILLQLHFIYIFISKLSYLSYNILSYNVPDIELTNWRSFFANIAFVKMMIKSTSEEHIHFMIKKMKIKKKSKFRELITPADYCWLLNINYITL